MVRKRSTQFSLLEMLLGFALLTALCGFQLIMLRLYRTESGWSYFLSAKMLPYYSCAGVILGLAMGMRYAMRAANEQQSNGWWLILSASLFVLVNGLLVQVRDPLNWFFVMGTLAFIDFIAVLIMVLSESGEQSPSDRPRPRAIAIGFHLLVMGYLVFYNLYVISRIMKSI